MKRDDQLTHDIRHTAKETEGTLSRVEKALYEATDTANDVTSELHRQGDALRKIDRNLDEVDEEAKYGEKMAKQVNKGFFGWMFSKEPHKAKPAATSSAPETHKPQAHAAPSHGTATSQPAAARVELNYKELEETGNKQLAQDMRQHDDTYNKQLDNISSLLDGLNVQAQAIGEELVNQNELLERVDKKSDATVEHVHGVNQQLHNFTRK